MTLRSTNEILRRLVLGAIRETVRDTDVAGHQRPRPDAFATASTKQRDRSRPTSPCSGVALWLQAAAQRPSHAR